MPVEPKLAATVILLRERTLDLESDDDCKFEVFMAKRHENARFMSEHCFQVEASMNGLISLKPSKSYLRIRKMYLVTID